MTDDELTKQAEKWLGHYHAKIRPLVYPQQKGRMLVLDIESGDYEIADRESLARERLQERRTAPGLLVVKIGYRAASCIPGRWVPEEEC